MSDANDEHRANIQANRDRVAKKLALLDEELARLDAEAGGAGKEFHLRATSMKFGIDPDNMPLLKARCDHCGRVFKSLPHHTPRCALFIRWKKSHFNWTKNGRQGPAPAPQWMQWQRDRLVEEGYSSAVYHDPEGYWGVCECSWISPLFARAEGAQFKLDHHLKSHKKAS